MTLAQEHGIAVADFNLDTPITTTKPARDESAKPVKDTPEPAGGQARRQGGHRRQEGGRRGQGRGRCGGRRGRAPHGHAGKPTDAGDAKDPEVRAAESRNPDASTPAPDATSAGLPADGPDPVQPSGSGRRGGQSPAGDGKPAGDTARGESVVSENTDDAGDGQHREGQPGWTGAKHANEEKK